MNHMYNVSASPHIRSKTTTASIMRDVVIALIPAGIHGIYNFGLHALLIITISIAVCLLSEYIYEKILKKPVTIGDFSAVVTGLLLAYNLPPAVPLWLPAIGGVFAILVVKMLYGGIGQNFMNPALAARCFLTVSFAGYMVDFHVPDGFLGGAVSADVVSSATPLSILRDGGSYQVLDLFLGRNTGTIGETSVILILLGGIYLLARRVITLRIPVFYLGAFLLTLLLCSGEGRNAEFILAHLFSGGLLLGVFFMATDYATSPITGKGQAVYGMILGALTGMFRVYGASTEGISFIIIFGNLLVPIIDRLTLPKMFGKGALADEE